MLAAFEGARWVDSPRELAERAGAVLSMLPDLPELERAAAGTLRTRGAPGPLGAGEVAKACNQLVVAATITALSPSGIARYMVKDLAFAADVAAATGTSPALLPTLRAFFDEIVERGHGERDIAVSRRVIAER